MIEPIMFFGIGFLVAALVGLVVVPLVHTRAVRLTMRRLEAAAPLSMAEISSGQGSAARRICHVDTSTGNERRATQDQKYKSARRAR